MFFLFIKRLKKIHFCVRKILLKVFQASRSVAAWWEGSAALCWWPLSRQINPFCIATFYRNNKRIFSPTPASPAHTHPLESFLQHQHFPPFLSVPITRRLETTSLMHKRARAPTNLSFILPFTEHSDILDAAGGYVHISPLLFHHQGD